MLSYEPENIFTEIDLVDKSIHRHKMKAIFYDLALLHHEGKPYKSAFLLCFMLVFTIFLFVQKPTLYLLGAFPALFILIAPFCLAAITYNSKLYIHDGKFEVRCGPFKFHSGSLASLIEIHHLKHKFDGIYRVRVPGIAETSGFVLHYQEVPEPLRFLKVIEKEV